MGLHFVIFSLGRNGLYCYGFPNLRMRFCGMYGVPACLGDRGCRRIRTDITSHLDPRSVGRCDRYGCLLPATEFGAQRCPLVVDPVCRKTGPDDIDAVQARETCASGGCLCFFLITPLSGDFTGSQTHCEATHHEEGLRFGISRGNSRRTWGRLIWPVSVGNPRYLG